MAQICPQCKGDGSYWVDKTDKDGKTHKVWTPCNACNGSGEKPEKTR